MSTGPLNSKLRGAAGRPSRVTNILYERCDNPMFCLIMSRLAPAFADSAFKGTGIEKPEGLFSLEIPHFKEPLAIQWKPGCSSQSGHNLQLYGMDLHRL